MSSGEQDRQAPSSKAAFRDLSAENWSWHPAAGRWRPHFGHPRTPGCVRISTEHVSPDSAYDFWRDLVFYNFDADPQQPGSRGAFSAEGFGTPNELAELYYWRSSAMQGRRTLDQIGRDGEDTIALGFVLEGERHAVQADGRTFASTQGQPFIYDSARESRLRWTDHEGIYISVRRSAVTAALGTDVPAMADLTAKLATLPVISLIRDQLTATARSFESLTGQERAFVLEQSSRLATFALLRVGTGKPADDRSARAAVYAAAAKLIEREFGSSRLTPDWIAAAIGCSRATLYRAFSDQKQTVMGTIQSVRLEQAQGMLLSTGPELHVGEVAARCGFYDLSTFSTRFRRRFGYRPGDLRREKTVR